MISLQDIQKELLNTVFDSKKNSDALSFIKKYNDISVAARFDVHRQTILQNFVNALKITFPGVWELIGDECAEGAALAYSHQVNNLPYNSGIEVFGDKFPEFLARFESTRNLKYLPDFAKLEWARNLSYNAVNTPVVEPEKLTAISPEVIESTKLIFNPSIFFIESLFPLDKIQDLLDSPSSTGFDLSVEPNFILVCRSSGKVITLWMEKGDWLFLKELSGGQMLGIIMERHKKISQDKISYLFGLMIHYKMLMEIS